MAVVKENPFKEIEKPLKKVPPEIRGKVMADVAAAMLVMDLVSLFTANYSSTFESILKTRKRDI